MRFKVWQTGYTTCRDEVLRDTSKAVTLPKGFVIADSIEEAWDLLNWSCWTSKKPIEVISDMEYCNSDIILSNNFNEFWYAKPIGWGVTKTLEDAIAGIKQDRLTPLNAFSDVKGFSGYVRIKNGIPYYKDFDSDDESEWIEITW